MADAFDSITKIVKMAGKQKHTMNWGMRHPLISMLYLTILIVREVLLVGTGADTEVPIATIGTTHIAIPSRLQGTIHPSKAANKEPACYHCVGPHYIKNCAKCQEDKDKYKHTKQTDKTKLSKQVKIRCKEKQCLQHEVLQYKVYFEMRKMTTWWLLRGTIGRAVQVAGHWLWMTTYMGGACEWSWWWYQPNPV